MASMVNKFDRNNNCSNNFSDDGLLDITCNTSDAASVMEFHQNSTVIIVYSALFMVAAVGNLTVFISLFRSRHRKSRISLMIRHLAIADLIVTFIMIPIEVGWRLTGKWMAGNVACKVFLFLRAFGPYLSSNVLVCVSLDRYFAVLHPLKVNDARRRGKVMLAFAWSISFIYCIPQSFVFRVRHHPRDKNYEQCVSFGFFTSTTQEIAYNLMCVMCMYFIPLFVIIVAYTTIMCEISKNSKDTKDASYHTSNGRMRLRRSDISNIERARSRTLRMTITIVAVYVWCCTPYVIITMWYMFDRASATSLPGWLQDTFFMMVVSNSCMNPIVYGSYVINFKSVKFKCLCCGKTNNDTNINNEDTQMVAAAVAERGNRTTIARGVIKCVLRLRKVRSGATTAMVHGIGQTVTRTRSPTTTPKNVANNYPMTTERLHDGKACGDFEEGATAAAGGDGGFLQEKPTNNVNHISFLSERRQRQYGHRHYRSTFHSEPCCPTNRTTFDDDLCSNLRHTSASWHDEYEMCS